MSLREQIKAELKAKDAVLVAHYYVSSDLQSLADETGGIVSDSLEMARFGHNSDAKTIIVAGVKFMGETAKILSPEKNIHVLDMNATCSLDEGCNADEFSDFCDKHSDRKVVVYANTSAQVKARADWMVTSGSAVSVINHLHELGEKILWAPDKHLGNYVQEQSSADMILWDGSCVVHEKFKADALETLKSLNPDSAILVHPESPKEVISLADFVGSTTALIKEASRRKEKTIIVATDNGIFHKMREAAPDKKLIEAPTMGESADCESCAHCEWMAMNSLDKCLSVLRNGDNEIFIDTKTSNKAKQSIQKLLDFTA
ncbi:MAG: quinolinate synthase NadA [PS1 clade bacterium]|jgi:quinolinate synthase